MNVILYDKSTNKEANIGNSFGLGFVTGDSLADPNGVIQYNNFLTQKIYNPSSNKVMLTFEYGVFKTLTNRDDYVKKNIKFIIKINSNTIVDESLPNSINNLKTISYELACNPDGSLKDTNIYLRTEDEAISKNIYTKPVANAHFKKNDTWKKVFVWMKKLGVWKRCMIWKKINGIWKRGI